jgi:hypothetical protein
MKSSIKLRILATLSTECRSGAHANQRKLESVHASKAELSIEHLQDRNTSTILPTCVLPPDTIERVPVLDGHERLEFLIPGLLKRNRRILK